MVEQREDLLLKLELFLQQPGALPGGGVIEQACAQAAAHLPGGGRDVEPRSFGEILAALKGRKRVEPDAPASEEPSDA